MKRACLCYSLVLALAAGVGCSGDPKTSTAPAGPAPKTVPQSGGKAAVPPPPPPPP